MLSYPCPPLERYQAFTGLLSVLHHHPDLLHNKTQLYAMLVACNSYQDVPPDLCKALHELLSVVKTQNPALWERVLRTFGQAYSAEYLHTAYGV